MTQQAIGTTFPIHDYLLYSQPITEYCHCLRRGARVVDRGALEKRCGREVTVGSNPTLSAE